jgi:hypothetical protein
MANSIYHNQITDNNQLMPSHLHHAVSSSIYSRNSTNQTSSNSLNSSSMSNNNNGSSLNCLSSNYVPPNIQLSSYLTLPQNSNRNSTNSNNNNPVPFINSFLILNHFNLNNYLAHQYSNHHIHHNNNNTNNNSNTLINNHHHSQTRNNTSSGCPYLSGQQNISANNASQNDLNPC